MKKHIKQACRNISVKEREVKISDFNFALQAHCTKFAAAMQSDTPLYINLAQAAQAPQSLDTELHNRFFEDLDQEEIIGGNVSVHLDIRSLTNDIFTIKVHASGEVTVACDRCLDNLVLGVETQETVRLKYSQPDESDAPDMIYADTACALYDLSWTIYEIIETSLPLQRTHPEGECNPEVMRYIRRDEGEVQTNEAE